MKRLLYAALFLTLSLLLLIGCDPLGESTETTTAATTAPVTTATPAEEFEYEISEDGSAIYITRYIGTSDEVIIPKTINGIPVLSLKGLFVNGVIEKGVFEGTAVKAVTIPEGITAIGLRAFAGCTELFSLMLPVSINRLLDAAFEGCTALERVDLSHTAISLIGLKSFRNCTALTEVSLPPMLERLYGNTFENCSALERITIPPHLDLMNSDPLPIIRDLPSLSEIVFEEGRTEVMGYGFFATTEHVRIVFPKSLTKISPDTLFIYGTADIVFLGNRPTLANGAEFHGETTIYYDPTTEGWEDCTWPHPIRPIE